MLSTNQRRCEVKSYGELKSRMEDTQQRMAKAKKSERTNS
jgi:hypothetical protein